MFEMLGLTPQNHLQKFLSLLQLSCELSIYHTWKNQNGQDQVTLLTGILKPQLKEKFSPYKKNHSVKLNGFFIIKQT
jgi:hypothetical protein